MKTLAYFGCGIEPMDFTSFRYDRIILIDYNLANPNTILEEVIYGKKIINMACDAFVAIDLLKEQKIKLDCFISINEGLYEGGGFYPLNGSYFYLIYHQSLMIPIFIFMPQNIMVRLILNH